MKFGEQRNVQPTNLSAVDSAVMEHLKIHGLTTVDVWDFATELKPHGRKEVGTAIRRLIHQRIVKRFHLYHGRYYFVLSAQAQQSPPIKNQGAGLYSEPVKLILYARSVLMSKFREEFKPVDVLRFTKLFSASFPGQSRSFLLNVPKSQSFAFMRIDNRVQSRPARAAQVIRTDILQLAKNPQAAELMKCQQFEYIWITTTQPRAKAVLEKFRLYFRVGTSPVTVIVMPELLPLLVGVPIHKEILTPR